MEIAYSTTNIEKNNTHQQHKDSPSSPEVQMEGYVGVLRSHANEPVLVRDMTSSGHLYQPVLVTR